MYESEKKKIRGRKNAKTRKNEATTRTTDEGRARYQTKVDQIQKRTKDVLGMGRHERIRKRESPVHTLDFP